MNWNRDKNSWEEKAVNGEINCMLSFGGKFKTMNWSRDKNSSAEKGVNREILLHVGLCGGKFKQ